MAIRRILPFIIVSVSLGTSGIGAQYQPPSGTERTSVSVIAGKKQRKDLPPEAFVVEEDGKPCRVERIVIADEPSDVAFIFDFSGSMAEKNVQPPFSVRRRDPFAISPSLLAEATKAFMAQGHPDNQYLVVGLSDQARILQALTKDRGQVVKTLGAQFYGRTALYDGLVLAMDGLAGSRATRRALVLVTDGEDNRSNASLSSVEERIKDGRFEPCFIQSQPDIGYGLDVGRGLTRRTGGLLLLLTKAEGLGQGMALSADILRYRYLIDYWPNTTPAGKKKHSVEVRVKKEVAGEKCTVLGARRRVER